MFWKTYFRLMAALFVVVLIGVFFGWEMSRINGPLDAVSWVSMLMVAGWSLWLCLEAANPVAALLAVLRPDCDCLGHRLRHLPGAHAGVYV